MVSAMAQRTGPEAMVSAMAQRTSPARFRKSILSSANQLNRSLTHQMSVRPYVAPPSRARAVLEVERKFNVTHRLRSYLDVCFPHQHQLRLERQAQTARLSCQKLANTLIRDQYFDLNDILASQGVWIRRRTERTLLREDEPLPVQEREGGREREREKKRERDTTQWEAKVKLGGNYQNSQFEEVTGQPEVEAVIQSHGADLSALQLTVDLDTFRESWMVREEADAGEASLPEVQVAIDTSSAPRAFAHLPPRGRAFKHVVGELEFTSRASPDEDDEQAGRSQEMRQMSTRRDTHEMSTRLAAFMSRHAHFFPTSPAPVGKLTAYFAWKGEMEKQWSQSQ